MAARAMYRPLLLIAMIQGLSGFSVLRKLSCGNSWKGRSQTPSSCTHPAGRSVKPPHTFRGQMNGHIQPTLRNNLVKSAATDEDTALDDYSPRLGEKAQPLRRAATEKNKVQMMVPTQYLGALKECAVELEKNGIVPVWVGGGQDTFYHALGVQLKNAGITRPVGSTGSTSAPNGYDFTPSKDGVEGTFPAACRQIRLDIVRCIISNVERLGQFAVGAERDLYAAAMRFQVRIVCFEISNNGKINRVEYLPQEGVEPRTDLFLCRKGEHFVSARAQHGTGDHNGIFGNIKEVDVLSEMREKAQYMGLKFEEGVASAVTQAQQAPDHAAAVGDNMAAEVFTWASGPPHDVTGGRRLLREVLHAQTGFTLDMPEKQYSSGGNNFFNSFAAELKRLGVPMKTTVVSSASGNAGKGAVLDVEAAARLVRTELIMYSNAHAAKFAGMLSPIKEMKAAACKYNVHVICFELVKGVVAKNVYAPLSDGVVPRAELLLARDGDKFWAVSPSQQLIKENNVTLVTVEIVEIPAGINIPVGYEDVDEDDVQPAALAREEALSPSHEQEVGSEPQEKSVVFDKKTLSWKMMTKEEQAKVQAELASDRVDLDTMAGRSGNYLPRFSQFKSNPNSKAPPTGKATVADAMLAGQISNRNGKINIDTVALANRRASAGITNEVQISVGMLQLEAKLAEQGKVIDLNHGGGNAYLVIAELMYHHKLEIQGLILTRSGDEGKRNALVGAMSRKAREDVKTYMYHNPEVFAKAGQWVGDHDCLAMARRYKMRIVVSRVIYDDEIQECVYGPEDGVEPRGELHVILDRKIFWAVKTLESFEKQQLGEEEETEEVEIAAPRKRLSAYEKVMAKYGKKDEVEEVPQLIAKTDPKKSDEGEHQSIISFKDMHVVKAVREHSATVIWLHGLGGDGQEWKDMAEALHMPWIKFVFPASHPVECDLWGGNKVSAWFDLSPAAYQVHSNSMNALPEIISRIFRKIQPDCNKIDAATALVQELVRKEIKSGISQDRIILAGFSQGATIALHAALTMDENIAGVVALSMWHLPSITEAEAVQGAKRSCKLPVLFCHGTQDKLITSDFAKHMCSEMSSVLDINYAQFDDLAHDISGDELIAMRQFLMDSIPGQSKYDSLNQLPSIRSDMKSKSNAKVWGDGSEVSSRRANAEFLAVASKDKAALDAMVQEVVNTNLQTFATAFVDPGADLWVDLKASLHEKSRKMQQK